MKHHRQLAAARELPRQNGDVMRIRTFFAETFIASVRLLLGKTHKVNVMNSSFELHLGPQAGEGATG